eukprot:scaffold19489_cov110-Isochrysis_galbana.AAC.8
MLYWAAREWGHPGGECCGGGGACVLMLVGYPFTPCCPSEQPNFRFAWSWELQPADARAAPSACAPTTLSMAMPLPPSHPRSPVKGNMVSPRATHAASAWPEHQHKTTVVRAPRDAQAKHC